MQASLLLNGETFNQKWREFGEVEGAEHRVFAQAGRFYKCNNLLYHGTWLEYFHRLVLHNWLFPDTALRFEGFILVDAVLQPVVSQKAIRGVRGATRGEVETEMRNMGFLRRRNDDYFSPTLQILVEDLHDENVLVDADGDLFIFDPVIYLAKLEWKLPMP